MLPGKKTKSSFSFMLFSYDYLQLARETLGSASHLFNQLQNPAWMDFYETFFFLLLQSGFKTLLNQLDWTYASSQVPWRKAVFCFLCFDVGDSLLRLSWVIPGGSVDSLCCEASSETHGNFWRYTELELLLTIKVTEHTGHFNLRCSDYKMSYK